MIPLYCTTTTKKPTTTTTTSTTTKKPTTTTTSTTSTTTKKPTTTTTTTTSTTTTAPVYNGYEYVDLGITGNDGKPLYFATCNIGASAPEEYGDYFMWGSTTPNNDSKCYWDDPNLPYHSGTSPYSGFTKYISTGKDSYGTVDNKLTLDPEDDAAHVIMGGNWRMPTSVELQKLADLDSTWTTENGVYGRKWTATNGNSLFIPAAGWRINNSFGQEGSYGYVWSSKLASITPSNAYHMSFNNSNIWGTTYDERCRAITIRAVFSNA